MYNSFLNIIILERYLNIDIELLLFCVFEYLNTFWCYLILQQWSCIYLKIMIRKYCISKNIYLSSSSPSNKLLLPLFSIPFSPIWSNSREHMSSMFTNWEEFHLKINLLFNTILYFSIGLTTYVIYVNVSEDLQIVFIVSYFLCSISYFSSEKIVSFFFITCYLLQAYQVYKLQLIWTKSIWHVRALKMLLLNFKTEISVYC